MGAKYFQTILTEPDFVKHVVSRSNSNRSLSQFKENFWGAFLDDTSRQVVCASILSDLASPLSFNAIMGLCVLDVTWPELVPVLCTAILSSEESVPNRAAAARALKELAKLKSSLYVIPQTFAAMCLEVAAGCTHEKLLSSLFSLMAEFRVTDPLALVKLALESLELHPSILPDALALIGAQSARVSIPDKTVESIAAVLRRTLNAEDSSGEVLREALALCANLVEVDLESGSDSRGRVHQYMSSVVPALLDRFSRGAPISLIVDASFALNLMTSLLPEPMKAWLAPFVREKMGAPDVRVAVAAMNLLGVLCEIPDHSIHQLVKTFLPELLRSLEASPEKARREAALYLVDQIPKYHISVFLPENQGNAVHEGLYSSLDSLVDRVLDALRDSSPLIVQRAVFALVNLVSSLPVAHNIIMDQRYHEVFDAAIEILHRPSSLVYPEIIFAVDDLLGMLIIHCSDEELPFLVERCERLVDILGSCISAANLTPVENVSESTIRIWELNYDQPHLRSPEETICTPAELDDRNRRARVSVVSSALSSILQRLPQAVVGPFPKCLPLAIKALDEWGFTDDNMSLLWHLLEALPAGTFSDQVSLFRDAARKSLEDCTLADACSAARCLADMARTFTEPDLKTMLDAEWVISPLLEKSPTLDRTSSSEELSDRAGLLLTLASVASTLGPRIKDYIGTFENVLSRDAHFVRNSSLCCNDDPEVSQGFVDLTYAICTSFSALLILIEREAAESSSQSLESLVGSFCVSLYRTDQATVDEKCVPIGFIQDQEAQSTLNRKILMLARTLQSLRGAPKCAELLNKPICEAMESIELNLDSFIEDIVEISGL